VLSRGAVELDGVSGIELRGCTWAQCNGNALSLAGAVHDSVIADGDFIRTGDSAVVSVGRLPEDKPYDGKAPGAAFPKNITIERCHFGQVGVYGKQTSALFVAVSEAISFIDNVLYGCRSLIVCPPPPPIDKTGTGTVRCRSLIGTCFGTKYECRARVLRVTACGHLYRAFWGAYQLQPIDKSDQLCALMKSQDF
jgi:hypothetical protein